MIKFLIKGLLLVINHIKTCMYDHFLCHLIIFCSFVENILPRFNDCTDSFIKRLQSLADGNTDVSMKWQTYITAFDFISKVRRTFVHTYIKQ